MQWQKLGQIFHFDTSPFAKRFVSHAQSPQAIVFSDFVRIYFTTRLKDSPTSYISIPQFIDYSFDFKEIRQHSTNNIISKGSLGCFDEHGIFPFSPLRVGNTFYAYISGWQRRLSVDVDSGIGLAISKDNGQTFTRLGAGPVLSSSLYEPFLVIDGFVQKFDNIYYMFYIFGVKWHKNTVNNIPERVYKIAYATSMDGIHWKKAHRTIIPNVIDENECQALPTVIKIGDVYHMYFCYRHMLGFRTEKNKSYRLGYAYSYDLENWIRDDAKAGIYLSKEGFDSEMMCYPNVFKLKDEIYMLYNGNKFGKNGFGLAKLVTTR